MADLEALVSRAAGILDRAVEPFLAGHRADPAGQKKGNDFATARATVTAAPGAYEQATDILRRFGAPEEYR